MLCAERLAQAMDRKVALAADRKELLNVIERAAQASGKIAAG
jgi:hypothetical protein